MYEIKWGESIEIKAFCSIVRVYIEVEQSHQLKIMRNYNL